MFSSMSYVIPPGFDNITVTVFQIRDARFQADGVLICQLEFEEGARGGLPPFLSEADCDLGSSWWLVREPH